jgi:hypothetical protein
MRALIAPTLAVCVLGALTGPASAAEAPPLILFHAPPDAPDSVRASRDALDQLARRRGTALIDLSPRKTAAPRAGEQLRRAVEAYQDFRYDQALAALERGIAEATRTGGAGLSPAELSDLFIYRALVHTQRGDTASAWEDFLAAATLAPSRRLDPVRFSPRVIESFGRAVETVAAEEPINLTVEAPAACTVVIDGRALTDLRTVALRRGLHYARVECPEHRPFAARFTVDAGTTTLRPKIVPVPAPDRDRALAEARRRGATSLIWAVATGDDSPTITLHLIDATTGKERARVFGKPGSKGGAAALVRAAEQLIDQVVSPAPPLVVHEGRRWYQNPWLWGAAGAAVATAILLPFAIDSGPPDSWNIEVPYPR